MAVGGWRMAVGNDKDKNIYIYLSISMKICRRCNAQINFIFSALDLRINVALYTWMHLTIVTITINGSPRLFTICSKIPEISVGM